MKLTFRPYILAPNAQFYPLFNKCNHDTKSRELPELVEQKASTNAYCLALSLNPLASTE